MNTYRLHTLETAPAGSSPVLEAAGKGLGFIPNLYAHLAESPAALNAYTQLGSLLEKGAFTPVEQQVILLAASTENRCGYCVAAHSFIARNMAKAAPGVITALREGLALPDPKLDALASFARAVVRQRGWVAGSAELESFHAAGYTQRHALEIVLGVAMKTLSNYASHLIDIPLDAAFEGEVWSLPDEHACCAH
ncbi:MAG: carboxymuconolactone decarboxylase family protein [Ectothiorhodospiraceae bacterium]|jgi:uncharacterized peroxidase-related enzyme|nr:carboxymuconolactone decarboxylase family protein [Ectothiorhodospiraceae bacterium]